MIYDNDDEPKKRLRSWRSVVSRVGRQVCGAGAGAREHARGGPSKFVDVIVVVVVLVVVVVVVVFFSIL